MLENLDNTTEYIKLRIDEMSIINGMKIKKSLSHKNNVFNIFKVLHSAGNQFSNHPPHFEESLEVINLTQSHGDQDKGLEHRPHDDSAVGVFVDCSVDSISDLHILLLMLDPRQSSAQLLDHVLQLVVTGLLLSLVGGVTRSLTNVHAEHDNLGCHGAHLIGETILVNSIHVGGECVFSVRLSFSLMNCFTIWSNNPDINVKETTLCHFKH